MAADARCWDQHRDRQARSYLCIIPTCNLRQSLFLDAERCLALQPLRLRETLGRGLRWRCQRRQCHGWCVDCYEVDKRVRRSLSKVTSVLPASCATAAETASAPRRPYCAARVREWSAHTSSKTRTVTCGSRLRAIVNAWACPGAWRVRLIAPATSTSARFGTMIGSAWSRTTSRNWRLTRWPGSRWSKAFTHTLASTVYIASPPHRQHGRRQGFCRWGITAGEGSAKTEKFWPCLNRLWRGTGGRGRGHRLSHAECQKGQ